MKDFVNFLTYDKNPNIDKICVWVIVSCLLLLVLNKCFQAAGIHAFGKKSKRAYQRKQALRKIRKIADSGVLDHN